MIETLGELAMAFGGLVHGGALVVFALLLAFRRSVPGLAEEHVVRVYRAFGAGIGLSLGVLVLGALVSWPAAVNPGAGLPWAYALRWDSGGAVLTSVRALLFLALWVSYVVLEIWTLDPCRSLDRGGEIVDRPAYARATARVTAHLGLNAALFVAIVALGAFGAGP